MRYETRVVGVTFERRQDVLRSIKLSSRAEIVPEPRNPYDSNALAVWAVAADGERLQIGYVPRTLAAEIAPKVAGQRYIPAEIVGYRGGSDDYPTIGVVVAFEVS